MKNQKIGTVLGTIIIILIAITVGAFVWKYEKNHNEIPILNANIKEKAILKNQLQEQPDTNKQVNCLLNNDQKKISWNVFKNDQFGFSIEYPSTFIYNETFTGNMAHPPGVGTQYVISLGVPTQENNSTCMAGNNFIMYIIDKRDGLNDYIKNARITAGAVENSFEPVGTEMVAGYTASIIKTCDQGSYCNKDIYFTNGKYIYFIRLSNYFTLKDTSIKEMIDHMLTSIKI